MLPRNRWGNDAPHCAFGQADPAGAVRQELVLSHRKRFAWQRPSSPASEAAPFVPKRPLLGSRATPASSKDIVVDSQPVSSATFPPTCPTRPYIGSPGTVHQAYSLALQLQVTEWVRLARLAAPHSSSLPEVLRSGKADMHLAKMVASYAPSTLAAYLSKWRHWIRFASACDANPYDPSIALLLIFWHLIPGASYRQRQHGSNLCGSSLGRRNWTPCARPCILILCQPTGVPVPSWSAGKVHLCRSVLSFFSSAES